MKKRYQLLEPGSDVAIVNMGQIHIVAGAGADGVEQSGPYISLDGRFGVRVGILWRVTLAAAATYTLVFNIQDAADSSGTGVADYGAAYASAVQSTGVNTDAVGVTYLDIALDGARSHIRIQHTNTLSAGSVDTCDAQALGIFSAESIPTS